MADINVRSDSVDVEQIMRQIRSRIREKRGADYTEAELQQLAHVKLEKFLDPRGIRSDLVEQYRRQDASSEPLPNFAFEDTTLYETHRGGLRTLRRLFRPFLKLLFNPDKITSALHIQAKLNAEYQRRFRQRDALSFEMIHNLVLELTRLGIEVQNLKMRVESLSSRLDFDERRGRALESVVEYRTPARPAPATPAPEAAAAPAAAEPGTSEGARQDGGRPEGPGGERRRRRRRRRRRPGHTLAESPNAAGGAAAGAPAGSADGPPPGDDEGDDHGGDEGPDDGPDSGAADQ
jgi:hypothetical protein